MQRARPETSLVVYVRNHCPVVPVDQGMMTFEFWNSLNGKITTIISRQLMCQFDMGDPPQPVLEAYVTTTLLLGSEPRVTPFW